MKLRSLACGVTAIGLLFAGAHIDPTATEEGTATHETNASSIELPPSGDADLDELRRLAANAPIDELCAKGALFLSYKVSRYRSDDVLWLGVDRLSREIVQNPDRQLSPALITAVIATIDSAESPPELRLRDRIPALRARREAMGARVPR